MSKSKNRVDPFPAAKQPDANSGAAVVRVSSSARTLRETIESIVIAFVLAFLFRTFEAEAFVIPTGSMAPTLQGRHKDVECPKCSRTYQASASIEAVEIPAQRKTVTRTICPQCGFHLSVDPRTEEGSEHPSYPGDRILVGKFSYEFSEPKRWDVIVFKYPEDAKVNYIKRLVALPGETVRIAAGNIYTKGPNQPEDMQNQFVIQRKPHDKLQAMLQMVYDNEYQPTELIEQGWPTNWASPADTDENAWSITDANRTFTTDGSSGEAWIRYRHIIPSQQDWQALKSGLPLRPQATLVTDHYAYNDTDVNRDEKEWVSDLAVELNLSVNEPRGTVVLELLRAGEPLQCSINLETGEATLSIPAIESFTATASTALGQVASHKLLFTNVDDELRLYIDGKPVEFNAPTSYTPTAAMHVPVRPELRRDVAAERDTSPVGIASIGASVTVSELKVLRDIHYRAISTHSNHAESAVEFSMKQFPDDPGLDQFFVLGDNSPQSKDSRLWEHNNHYVDRNLLIGKALYIYWPHSFDAVHIGETRIPFPFFPNFSRMGFVR